MYPGTPHSGVESCSSLSERFVVPRETEASLCKIPTPLADDNTSYKGNPKPMQSTKHNCWTLEVILQRSFPGHYAKVKVFS